MDTESLMAFADCITGNGWKRYCNPRIYHLSTGMWAVGISTHATGAISRNYSVGYMDKEQAKSTYLKLCEACSVKPINVDEVM